jgi:hypothetical protein
MYVSVLQLLWHEFRVSEGQMPGANARGKENESERESASEKEKKRAPCQSE